MNANETITSDNLQNKLPQNSLQEFSLTFNTDSKYHLTFAKFPNFVNFSKLRQFKIAHVNIIDTDSFVTSVLPLTIPCTRQRIDWSVNFCNIGTKLLPFASSVHCW